MIHPFRHFGGRLVGERDGENGVWRNSALLDQVSDPVGDDTRFPRTRACQDEHWAIDRLDCRALLGVQFLE